jgi:S-adenosyl-L-methionine hydrolase (adenosine-forming)
LITLLTDFGSNSFQTVRSRAWLEQNCTGQTVLDIAHDIHANDINEAAYVFSLVQDQFNAGTIHIIAIDFDERVKHPEVVYFQLNDQHIVTYNSGIASIILKQIKTQVFELGAYTGSHFNCIPQSFGSIVKAIFSGGLSDKRPLLNDKLNIKTALNPVTKENMLHGHVVYFDAQQTCYTNISKEVFDNFTSDGPFDIILSRHEHLSKITTDLASFEGGGTYCFFNTAGMLTISVYRGSAKRMYGLQRGQSIIIEKR